MTTDLEKDEALEVLKRKFNELEIPITAKDEFTQKYEWYKANRKTLIE
jgi:hypothetical protein